jgi:Ni,Fe-hydrogenase III component G
MKDLIRKRLNETALTKSDVKDEVKSQMDSNAIKKKIEDIVKNKIKDDKDLEDKVVEISKNVLTQLFKALWVKRASWRENISNKNS